MNAPFSVADILEAADTLEAWRPSLIAFCQVDGMCERAEGLRRGEPMDYLDRRMVEGLRAALKSAPR